MRILVLQHVDCEGPGLFAQFMREHEIPFHQVRLHAGDPIPDLSGYHALLVMGGPMGVYDEAEHPFLAEENKLIQKSLAQGRPFLGVCLGGQLLAKALGAPVTPNPVKEIGFDRVHLTEEGRQDRLFQGLGDPLPVFQWHGDTFAIPKGAVHLAASPACTHQAFRYGERAYALQFHLEVTPTMVREWAALYREELATRGQGVMHRVLPEDIDCQCHRLRSEAKRLFANFLLLAKEAPPF